MQSDLKALIFGDEEARIRIEIKKISKLAELEIKFGESLKTESGKKYLKLLGL